MLRLSFTDSKEDTLACYHLLLLSLELEVSSTPMRKTKEIKVIRFEIKDRKFITSVMSVFICI